MRDALQADLSKALLKPLPELLKAFQADAEKVEELVELPQYFALEEYRGTRQLGAAKELLRLLRELFFVHTKPEIHYNIGRTFRHLLATESSIYSEVDIAYALPLVLGHHSRLTGPLQLE